MLPIGLSSCGKVLDRQLFADYANSGLQAMEISPNWPDFKYLDYKALKTYSQEYGITLWSYHLPFQTVDLATDDRAWRLCATEYLSEQIKQASNIGIHKFVAHASSGAMLPEKRAEHMNYAKDSLHQLAEVAARFGSEICVEDLPNGLGRNSEEMLDLLSADDRLKVCFDTNHLLGEDNVSFVNRLGHKIVTLHVSDYDLKTEQHWLPGEGQVAWPALLAAIQAAGYNGVWMYEIAFSSHAGKRGRNLTCDDFSRNAKELFANQPLTV